MPQSSRQTRVHFEQQTSQLLMAWPEPAELSREFLPQAIPPQEGPHARRSSAANDRRC
jgi:hypothetical protein